MWGGHPCPPLLTLVLNFESESESESDTGKGKIKNSGQECPLHTTWSSASHTGRCDTKIEMPTFSCAAILFDLDGVLVDSTQAVDREWREWAARKGVDGDAIMAIAHGVRTIEVIRRVAPYLDAEAEAAAIENHEAGDQQGVTVMPGAIDLVRSIPDARWGVVTSGSRQLATNRLRYCGLPVPEVLVTSDDVTNGKPHPEPYLKGAEGLGVNPAECLVFEDAPAGIESARAGGMKVVGITSTYRAEALEHADAVIEKLGLVQVSWNGAGKLGIEVR